MTPRPRRIVYVTTDLRVGGAEAMLVRLVTAEPRLADDITVVSLLPAEAYVERLRAAGVAVVELGFDKLAGILSGPFKLARLIAQTKPDIVQGWMYHGDLATLIALALSGHRRQTKLVWSIRCTEVERRYGLALRLVVKACAMFSRRPDVITANSVAGLKSHLAIGYRPRRAEVIVNGIDVDAFKPAAGTRVAVRRELGIADDAIVLAHVARVDPMKDHGGFLAVMAQLPQLEALLIGAGTESLSVPPNVLRLGPRDDVARLLTASDIVVSSSRFGEGFSNVIAEGMACGLPAITTDVGDAALIVGDSGLIVPAGDATALTTAIRALAAESRTARAERGARARARIVENFAMAKVVERYHELYRSLSADDAGRADAAGIDRSARDA